MLKDLKYVLGYIFTSLKDPSRPITAGGLEGENGFYQA